jgi:hypothetical protein
MQLTAIQTKRCIQLNTKKMNQFLYLSFHALSVTNSQHSDKQNAQYSSSTCFDPQGVIIREPTKPILQKTKFATFVHSRHGVKE